MSLDFYHEHDAFSSYPDPFTVHGHSVWPPPSEHGYTMRSASFSSRRPLHATRTVRVKSAQIQGFHPSPLDTTPCATQRSLLVRPVVYQHNKHIYGTPTFAPAQLNTNGREPFHPRSPRDICLGDVIKFSRDNDRRMSRGRVHYVGNLAGHNDVYVGIELEHEIGKHDGVFGGYRYFQCKPNRGMFVPFDKIILVWSCC